MSYADTINLLFKRTWVFYILFVWSSHGYSEEIVMPEPLSLSFSLERALTDHPEINHALALQQRYQAETLRARSNNDLTVNVVASLRAIEPARFSLNNKNNDSRMALFARKTLYDFGRSEAMINSAENMEEGQQWQTKAIKQQRLISVMEAYFNVLLADMTFIKDNEAMSMDFVGFDKVREAHLLNRVSDLALLEAEEQYQRSRSIRYESELAQRRTRSQLAMLLNIPTSLPDNLESPIIGLRNKKAPEYQKIEQKVLTDNPLLRALRIQLKAAKERVKAAAQKYGPTLDAEFAATAYERETNSTHPVIGQLRLDIPIYSGERTDAEVAWARSEVAELNAKIIRLELDIRQQLLDAYLDIEQQNIELEKFDYQMDLRDLQMDRSRALYKMEMSTDIGDAMVNISDTRLQQSVAEMKLVMAWLRIKVLTGELEDAKGVQEIIAGNIQ